MISSYFASVGVGVDRQGIRNVDSYLSKIESKIKSFQKRIEKTTGVNVVIRLDQDRLNKQLRSSITKASRGLTLRLSKVEISRATLTNAINKAMVKKSPASSLIKIDAQLSQASLVHMRKQVRDYLRGVAVTTTVNVRGGRVPSRNPSGQGGNPAAYRTRDRGGLLAGSNPMLAGGAIGSAMRFGPYALPFVAGAYGLNALSNKAQTLESQQLLLNASAQDRGVSKSQMEYLSNLGDRLGATTESMVPFFAQLVAGSRGTEMESSLESGFSQFMDYASVVGLNAQQKEGALRAISQMLAKRRVQSEELRQQLAEHGMPQAVQIMADAVTGDGTRGSGDVAKLQKMMEMGQVDSIKALPKFFEALGREAAPWLEDYYQTISHTRGVSAKAQEDWMKSFLGSGGSTGVAVFFKTFSQTMEDSVKYAGVIGDIFQRAAYALSAVMLMPGEIFSYIRGEAGKGNFLTELFGESSGSKLFQGVIDSLNRMIDTLSGQVSDNKTAFSVLGNVLSKLDSVFAAILEFLTDAFEVGSAFSEGGIPGMKSAIENVKLRRKAQEIADFEADTREESAALAGETGFKISRADRHKRAVELYDKWKPSKVQEPSMSEDEMFDKYWYVPSVAGQYAGRKIRGVFENYTPEDNPHGWWNMFLSPEIADYIPGWLGGGRNREKPINLGKNLFSKLGLESFGAMDRSVSDPNFMMTTPQVAPSIYQNNPITINITEAQDMDEQKLTNLITRQVQSANEELLNSAGASFPRTVN